MKGGRWLCLNAHDSAFICRDMPACWLKRWRRARTALRCATAGAHIATVSVPYLRRTFVATMDLPHRLICVWLRMRVSRWRSTARAQRPRGTVETIVLLAGISAGFFCVVNALAKHAASTITARLLPRLATQHTRLCLASRVTLPLCAARDGTRCAAWARRHLSALMAQCARRVRRRGRQADGGHRTFLNSSWFLLSSHCVPCAATGWDIWDALCRTSVYTSADRIVVFDLQPLGACSPSSFAAHC